tara:strand:- start:74 stop:466 length:393 start_codon:yes stop_codon:yes gene_type:complete
MTNFRSLIKDIFKLVEKLNYDEIKYHNEWLIGTIEIRVSSKKVFRKWTERHFILTSSRLFYKRPYDRYYKSIPLLHFELSGIENIDGQLKFKVLNCHDKKKIMKIRSTNSKLLFLYNQMYTNINKVRYLD